MRRLDVHAKPAVILGTAVGDVVATTDDEGTFHIDELASGPWRLLIKAEGHPDKLEHGETTGRLPRGRRSAGRSFSDRRANV